MQAENLDLSGFGAHSAQEVERIQKALSLGADYSQFLPQDRTQGGALSVEDLDRTLKLVTHGMEHLKLWKDIIKEKVNQTVHEYNIQNSYGTEAPVFFEMGGTPFQTDAQYARDIAVVKYLGTQGAVQHNLTLIQAAHGPVVAREVKNKTVELLARNERAMFDADSSINALEYDGIDTLIRSRENDAKFKSTAFEGFDSASLSDTVILDLRNQKLDEDILEDSCLINVNNFGMAMDMYLSTNVHSDFSRTFYAKEVVRPGDKTAAGYLVPEFAGTLNFKFKPSLFNRPRRTPLATSISASAAPTLANETTPANAASKFGAADAGGYRYSISSVYRDGETVASAELNVAAVAAGDEVQVEITYTGTPLYFNVFRSAKDAGAAAQKEFIGRVAIAGSGNAHVIDRNATLPGRAKAYLLMHDPDTLCFKQLGSMIKYDLAVTDTSYRWLQLLYGTPVIQAPRKHVIIENIDYDKSLAL